jgi:hypothetical protein
MADVGDAIKFPSTIELRSPVPQANDLTLFVIRFRPMEPKVVIEQRILRALAGNRALQLLATVYLGTQEYRVYAPSRATGDPVEWVSQLLVHQPTGYGEIEMLEPHRGRMIEATLRALEQTKIEAAKAEADALYYEAQICMQGDVQSSDGTPFNPPGFCPKCGAACIHCCPTCKESIRGKAKYSAADYIVPAFCHGCGRPYPWMEDKLRTAKDLLFHDDKLTFQERTELWDLLKYVMSNPKADLAPAKSKLIMLKIQKAAVPIRDFVTDVIAKYAAEMSK